MRRTSLLGRRPVSPARVAVLLFVCSSLGCSPGEPKVGRSWLAEADGTVPAPEGATIEVGVTPIPSRLAGPVRVAIDRDVPYPQAIEALRAIERAGGQPMPLVAVRTHIEAVPPPRPRAGDAIKLSARTEGKACVSPPDNDEATCVSRTDHLHIDRAFVRQLLAQAVKEYGLRRVNVIIDPALTWADALRAIDGARTCCGAGAGIEVSVEPGW
jgi:hypothetical protein